MHPTYTRLVLTIAATVITVSVLVLMLLVQRLELTALKAGLIGSLGLVLVALPLLYFSLLRPLRAQVRQREGAEQALRESALWEQGILDTMFDGLIIVDPSGQIVRVNPAAARIFGYAMDELVGRPLDILIPPDHRERHGQNLLSFAQAGQSRRMALDREVSGLRKDGSTVPIEIAITELRRGEARYFVGVLRDITARKQAEAALRTAHQALEQRVAERTAELTRINHALQAEVAARAQMQAELERLATTDSLTGLRNRRAFDELLGLELTRTQRYGHPLALILFDIDRFKQINDRHGHQTGDRVLVELARVVGSRLRASEVFARWGGEEFILLAPHTDAAQAAHLAEEIRARVACHDFPAVGQVTISLGVTEYAPGDSRDSLLKRADAALYRAKAGGRNRVEVETA